MVEEIRLLGCIPMATPFDEVSVDLCGEFEMPIVKIASSNINDWALIERIASTRKPSIVSSGGASEKDLDGLVGYYEERNIPLAINHCVSLYPSEDGQMELDQIDYLKKRYTNHVIGLSTHEYTDWYSSMLISYGKGVRTWERHIDIDYMDIPVSPYCSLPQQCDTWYKAFAKAAEMCGGLSESRRVIPKKEIEYLDALLRGVYARRDLPSGYELSEKSFDDDFFLAIPLHKGQLSCREVFSGAKLVMEINANDQLTINNVDGALSENEGLKKIINNRGL